MMKLECGVSAVALVVFSLLSIANIVCKLFASLFTQTSKSCHFLRKYLCYFCPEPLRSLTDLSPRLKEIIPYAQPTVDVDLVKVNYLNLLDNDRIKTVAVECIRKHGVGTCAPRGQLNTSEGQALLETLLAKFLGVEQVIVYSYSFVVPLSVIPTHCKKIDVIFCDEKVSPLLEQGILAARSIVIYFKHNNMADLRHKLEEGTKSTSPIANLRKFLVVEGIYFRTGRLCPLPDLVNLCKGYSLKLFVDETISFGILGPRGRGITEYYDIGTSGVDLIIGSFEGALGSVGSFCAGSTAFIEQQKLSKAAQTFSTALPTFQVEAAIAALQIINDSPDDIFRLQLLSRKVHTFLTASSHYVVHSDPVSPYKVFNYRSRCERRKYEQLICKLCRENGVYLLANENGLIMNLNVRLYYHKNKILNTIEVLECAAQSLK